MSISNIYANLLDTSESSLLEKVKSLEFGVRRLENRTRIYVYNDIAKIGLTASTATCRAIKNNMNLDSRLVLAVAGGNYPNLDTPPRTDTVSPYQSGTIVFEANQLSPNRFACWFFNENGYWYRYFNDSFATTDARYDSGWIWLSSCSMQQQILTADLASKYGGKLANIVEPGQYFLAGSTVNSATDSPYGSSGSPAIYLKVERMQLDRGLLHTIQPNVTARESYEGNTTSAGVFGGFKQKLVAGVPFRQDVQTQGVSARTTNTYNIGLPSVTYSNGYFQNAITVVSDRDHKPIEEDVPDNILDIWGSISPKRYKYDWAIEEKGIDGARWHVGWIAQDILKAFSDAGEDATEWALITYNEWEESDGVPAGHQWRLVMDECLAMEALYQRRRLENIEKEVNNS